MSSRCPVFSEKPNHISEQEQEKQELASGFTLWLELVSDSTSTETSRHKGEEERKDEEGNFVSHLRYTKWKCQVKTKWQFDFSNNLAQVLHRHILELFSMTAVRADPPCPIRVYGYHQSLQHQQTPASPAPGPELRMFLEESCPYEKFITANKERCRKAVFLEKDFR